MLSVLGNKLNNSTKTVIRDDQMLFAYITLTFVTISLAPCTDAYRILVVVPMPSRSHSILGHGIARHLLEAGHEVVHVTPFPKNQPKANYSEVSVAPLEQQLSIIKEERGMMKIKNMVDQENFANSIVMPLVSQNFHEQLFDLEDFKNLLYDPKQKFDAVILEWFLFDGIAGIASIFQCPLIWFSTTEAHWTFTKLIDEIPNPAYTDNILSTYSPPLTFWQRAMELIDIISYTITMSAILFLKEKPTYYKLVSEAVAKRSIDVVPYEDSIYNGSLLLINSHPSYGSAFQMSQNTKYIGGFHVETKNKPLNKELQAIMDNAKHGVIYFSMGSNFKSVDMSDEMKTSVLKAFAKLKQTIIWKFEAELDNVPSNVHLVKWAPQQGILAHPNLKMFITHGGMLSTTEAIHHGVPVVGIPLAADQQANMKSVTSKGFGVTFRLSHDFGPELGAAIDKILSNPNYKIKAKEISAMYHDRPVPPGEELVFWVEHVVRTGGAQHLRSPALMVPWYQKMFLDLLAVITCLLVLVIYVARIVLKTYKRTKPKQSNKKYQ